MRILKTIGKLFGFLLAWALFLAPGIFTIKHFGGADFPSKPAWLFAAELWTALALLAATALMARLVDKRPLATIGFPFAKIGGLLAGTAIGLFIFCVPLLILALLGNLRFIGDFEDVALPALGLALATVFVNAAGQELIARGYIFQELWRKYSAATAIAISTILFVAMHGPAIVQGMPGKIAGLDIALAGILLGLAYARSGALWMPIGIHFGWNALQGPILGINVTGNVIAGRWHAVQIEGPELWTGGAMGVEGGLAGLFGPLAGIALVLLLVRPRSGE